MKLFSCPECGHTAHFESNLCVRCGATLGFLPSLRTLVAIPQNSPLIVDGEEWVACENRRHGCNWMVQSGDETSYCVSCRLNQTIPDLSVAGNQQLWERLEKEKRRFIYSALRLNLPMLPKEKDLHGLAFDFLADPDPSFSDRDKVLTGHANGLITLNIAEADPAQREKMRAQMDEPYRTILGHFRHESGHYYWEKLVRYTDWLIPFREIFGDEQRDYATALQKHYQNGPPNHWRDNFVSGYASAHPWEDWAESWSHYLHMVDTLETAWAYGLHIDPPQAGCEGLRADPEFDPYLNTHFDLLLTQWIPLTVALNSLNQSMGHEPAYPFTLPSPVTEKLRLIHRIIHRGGR